MKIAISAKGPGLDDQIDPRFGRAAWFCIVDPATMECKPIDNSQAAGAMQGAGIQSARTIINEGAEVLVTGHCGPKAFMTLKSAGIKVAIENEPETVGSAVEKFKKGGLSFLESPNVDGHWR